MGHMKVSQIKIHLIEIIKKCIGTCITKNFSHVFRKPNPSPIINGPYNRRDEFWRINWLLIGDGKHIPTCLHHGLHCFNIYVVHPIDLFLSLFDHYGRLLLKGELFIKKHFSTRIHISILTYLRFREATIREVFLLLHEVPIKSAKVFLDSIVAF